MMKPFFLILIAAIPLAAGAVSAAPPDLDSIRLPAGFSITIFADDVPNARSLALSPEGTVYVGTRREGRIYAIPDRDGDGHADTTLILDEGLRMPNGVAFRDGALFVAEVSRILVYEDVEENLGIRKVVPQVVNNEFPADAHHGWKFIAFGPDGKLYIPVGAPCNACLRDDPRYAAIHRMNRDGTGLELFASGVRNSVGFDWNPESGIFWFTDNGRDWLGDDLPPDELNRAPEKGMHFGFPYCHGGVMIDPDLGEGRMCDEFIPPARALGPHVASLGMRFYRGDLFPSEYQGRILIAEHGSWNRSEPVGYRISMVSVEDGVAGDYVTFADGWFDGQTVYGRPVDVMELHDGSLLVSDDYAGVIYRISYDAPEGDAP